MENCPDTFHSAQRGNAPEGWQRPFHAPLPPHVLNIAQKIRSSLFAWRGQFSPQLVESILRAYAEPGSVVLDPFMGSGTVLAEGARLGHEAHGFEVNPAAFSIARLYELSAIPPQTRARYLAEAEAVLDRVLGSDLPLFSRPGGVSGESLAEAAITTDDAILRSLLEALVVLSDAGEEPDAAQIHRRRWPDIKKAILDLPQAPRPVRAHLSDARRLQLADGIVDFVVSSPPYINVFNYHHNYRAAIESLGWKPLVVARSEIGSNRKFRQNRFLTVVQYCIDMALALNEIRRVGKASLRGVLILGRESNVHKTPFFNGDIVAALAEDINGFRVKLRQERVFQNRFGQSITEDILHLEPRVVRQPTDVTIDRAREFGARILDCARARVPDDRRFYLEDALARVSAVDASPILQPLAAK